MSQAMIGLIGLLQCEQSMCRLDSCLESIVRENALRPATVATGPVVARAEMAVTVCPERLVYQRAADDRRVARPFGAAESEQATRPVPTVCPRPVVHDLVVLHAVLRPFGQAHLDTRERVQARI